MSPTSDQSGRESPISELLDKSTVDGSDIGQSSSPAGPTIVVHGAETPQECSGSTEKTPEPVTDDRVSEKGLDSSSSRQDTPTPTEDLCIPSTIACNLRVTCEDSKLTTKLSVPLHTPESYQMIERVAEEQAKTLTAESVGRKQLKFFHGTCTIFSDSGTITRHPLRSPEDWTEVNKTAVGYWNFHTRETLRLCISCHYLASQQQPMKGESFAEVKYLEIDDLMKQTWEKKDYIPHNALEMAISDETIYWIIKEDPPKSVPPEKQDAFIRRVQAEGRILLAMCVHVSLRMECLKELLESGLKDSTLPLDEKFQCHQRCRSKLRKLVQTQGGYQAERFDEGEHKTLHSHAVVPLHFCSTVIGEDDLDREVAEAYGDLSQNPQSEEGANKRNAWCGSGAYSNVYCVKLNPNHHSLSVDLDRCFALKEFKDRPKLAKDFDRELAMLKELRKHSHPHIVTHLATWTQDERYYMLFPYARCNLRQYMGQNTFSKNDECWLSSQILGMAEAVKRIHEISDVESPKSGLNVMNSAAGERRTAWHHDIKPENILFFKENSSSRGIFRISDWGSAKVSTYRTKSYHTERPIGTLTYEPPEYTYEGSTSRPYDLWSLGCVFLELLVWAVFGSTNVDTFSENRNDKRNAKSGTGSLKDDAFWQQDGDEFKLRQTVVTHLQRLENELTKPGALPFKAVVEYVRRMLEPNRQKRIKAPELCALLHRDSRTKSIEVRSPRDEFDLAAQSSLTPTDHYSSDAMAHEDLPPNRSSGPAYAEHFNLSPSDMSPRASRHSRNSSASDMVPLQATHSRQSSNTSNLSIRSVRERSGSHSSANSPTATEGGL